MTSHNKLIERIGAIPADRLIVIERTLDILECGDSSPLCQLLTSPKTVSVTDLQRLAARIAANGKSGNELPRSKDWPHAPVHRISEFGTYIVTAGTYHKEHFFRGPERLDLVEETLLRLAKEFGWCLEAWAVFSNHYHFVAHAEPHARSLEALITHLHGETACEVNARDRMRMRKVWHNFRDTRLTFEKSYLARLNYVHQNAVKHGLVAVANLYAWCSARWFERIATPAQVKTIYSFKTDKVRIPDDYDPI
jgi:putative transposase